MTSHGPSAAARSATPAEKDVPPQPPPPDAPEEAAAETPEDAPEAAAGPPPADAPDDAPATPTDAPAEAPEAPEASSTPDDTAADLDGNSEPPPAAEESADPEPSVPIPADEDSDEASGAEDAVAEAGGLPGEDDVAAAPDVTPVHQEEPVHREEDVAPVHQEDPVEAPEPVGPTRDLADALGELRAAIGAASYPLVLPSADAARRVSTGLVAQLDDYLLPRLARLDAPLLVVVGGSTGAGKSTLVNSLVEAPVSAAGVLRPTTRAPVLVCHPADSTWFRKGDLLPGLTRTSSASDDPRTLQLVVAPALTPGLAFLDAPDIDSVVDANRALAGQLLAAADLWLFVTTAARYADAVPWELLRTARFRGTVTALVLDRVPAEAVDAVSGDLNRMLNDHGLAEAPLFVLTETVVDGQGLLPDEEIGTLREWFARLAADASARAAVVRQTLDGALTALGPSVEGLAEAVDEQAAAAQVLTERVGAAYRSGLAVVAHGVRDGTLLRGEVLARWQEFVGTGELLRTLEARIGRMRDRVVAAVRGRPAPGGELRTAIESGLVTLVRGAATDAAEQAYTGWQAHPAGAALLEPALARPSPDLDEKAERLVRDWQRAVLELVRAEAADKRAVARGAAYAVNATGLLVMVAVFASTAFIPTGAEIAVAGGTTVAAQKVLEAIFGDQAIRGLAGKAREDLLARVEELLAEEGVRYLELIPSAGAAAEPGGRLRAAAAAVDETRSAADLSRGPAALDFPGTSR